MQGDPQDPVYPPIFIQMNSYIYLSLMGVSLRWVLQWLPKFKVREGKEKEVGMEGAVG